MQKESSGYLSLPDREKGRNQLFYRLYEPDKPAKGSVLILHGMQEHSGRYEEIARFFARDGYAVLAYDHLGHGKTARNEEDLGFFQKEKPVSQLVDDGEYMARYLYKLYPEGSHFALGHSMGSFVLRLLLRKNYSLFSGAILVGTGGKNPMISSGKMLLTLLNTCNPRHRSKFLNKGFLWMNNRRFSNEIGGDETSWLSLNKKNREKFVEDAYNGVPFTFNGFYTVISLVHKAAKKNWADPISRDFPMLFVSGAEDPIGNFGKDIKQIVSDLHVQGFTEVYSKLYADRRHEILKEDIREEVFSDILRWMKKENKE